eukprot:1151440-Pelagomonas_calceolata.AAC.5
MKLTALLEETDAHINRNPAGHEQLEGRQERKCHEQAAATKYIARGNHNLFLRSHKDGLTTNLAEQAMAADVPKHINELKTWKTLLQASVHQENTGRTMLSTSLSTEQVHKGWVRRNHGSLALGDLGLRRTRTGNPLIPNP